MSLLDLTGKKILLTGGCGALGIPIIKLLVEHGASLLVIDILSEDDALKTLEQQSINLENITYYQTDITNQKQVQTLFSELLNLKILPDVVCCHAGMSKAIPIQDYPLEDFDKLMNLNQRAAFIVAQEATKHWLAQNIGGHLIFTTSWVQDVPWPEITPYNASKASLKMLMRGFARELAPKGIRANAIAPGIVAAGMAKLQLENEPEYKSRAEKAIPLGNLQSPESVANSFLFLCSEMADYMTGSVLLVDGGASLYPMDD